MKLEYYRGSEKLGVVMFTKHTNVMKKFDYSRTTDAQHSICHGMQCYQCPLDGRHNSIEGDLCLREYTLKRINTAERVKVLL